MPDNIWYNDYQIVKVNPGFQIEDNAIADFGNLEEFQQFVKTVSFDFKRDCNINPSFQKSADCRFVTYPNQNRKLLSKTGKRISIPTYASKSFFQFHVTFNRADTVPVIL